MFTFILVFLYICYVFFVLFCTVAPWIFLLYKLHLRIYINNLYVRSYFFFPQQKQGHWGESSHKTYFMSNIWLWLTSVRELSPPSLALQIKANLLFLCVSCMLILYFLFCKRAIRVSITLTRFKFFYSVSTLLLCVKCKQTPFTHTNARLAFVSISGCVFGFAFCFTCR